MAVSLWKGVGTPALSKNQQNPAQNEETSEVASKTKIRSTPIKTIRTDDWTIVYKFGMVGILLGVLVSAASVDSAGGRGVFSAETRTGVRVVLGCPRWSYDSTH